MNQMMPDPENVEHRLVCDNDGRWTCSCGRAGGDVDAILRTLGPEHFDPGDDEWGGANLEPAATDPKLKLSELKTADQVLREQLQDPEFRQEWERRDTR